MDDFLLIVQFLWENIVGFFDGIIFWMRFFWPAVLMMVAFFFTARARAKKAAKREAEVQQEWIDYQAKQTALELDKLQHPEKYEDIEN